MLRSRLCCTARGPLYPSFPFRSLATNAKKALQRPATATRSSVSPPPLSSEASPSPVRLRAVVAISPDAAARSAILGIQAGLSPILDETRVKWILEGDICFPLQLYPDLDTSSLADLNAMLQKVANVTNSFEISLKGIGVVPSWRKPRKLWLGIDQGRDTLRRLAQRVKKEIGEVSISARKDSLAAQFAAQLTIGTWSDVYVKELNSTEYRDSCILHGNRFQAKWKVLRSTLTKDGEHLERLISVPLAGPAALKGPLKASKKP